MIKATSRLALTISQARASAKKGNRSTARSGMPSGASPASRRTEMVAVRAVQIAPTTRLAGAKEAVMAIQKRKRATLSIALV